MISSMCLYMKYRITHQTKRFIMATTMKKPIPVMMAPMAVNNDNIEIASITNPKYEYLPVIMMIVIMGLIQ